MPLIQRQVDFCEFQASLAYTDLLESLKRNPEVSIFLQGAIWSLRPYPRQNGVQTMGTWCGGEPSVPQGPG